MNLTEWPHEGDRGSSSMYIHLIKMQLGDRAVLVCSFQEKKNKHNRIFWDFLSKLMTPLFCCIWVMCILSPKVLSKILASAVISIFLSAERSLSTFRGSQCHILGIAVAWNWAALPVIPALLLVGWADLEYITSLLKALTPCIQNGDPDSYFIFKELEDLLAKMS